VKISLKWLREFVDVDWGVEEFVERLTMAGLEAESVEDLGSALSGIVVGKVLECEPHPDADRLSVCRVDAGESEPRTIVCGAPNVAAGQKIAFAREGARVVSPRTGEIDTLKAGRIRGVVSAGMVCSALELGLGDDHEGIVVLDEDAPVGTPLAEYMGDAVLDLDVPPNRPDCLSVLGVAHEVAALTGAAVTEPDLS